jgi:DNA replication protein DnaC
MTVAVQRPPGVAAGCDRCKGAGVYYDPNVEIGRFGRLRLCTCVEPHCRCRGQRPYQFWDDESRRHWCPCRPYRLRLEETEALFRQADMPERYRWKFQDSFRGEAEDGTLIPLANRAKSEVEKLLWSERPPVRGYLLHGGPGAGKTLLGCIMVNELMLRWCRAGRFLNLSRKYFERLRDTYSEDSEHYGKTWQMMEELCNMPFLMLDDLGTQRNTEWELEMLYNLVDARYGDERFTVVTTNKPLGEIKEIAQGRIYSRLVEMCEVMEMQSADYREHRVW